MEKPPPRKEAAFVIIPGFTKPENTASCECLTRIIPVLAGSRFSTNRSCDSISNTHGRPFYTAGVCGVTT